MARILILMAGPLWSNPRSQKEAIALSAAGHAVAIGGIWYDDTAAERDAALSSGEPWSFTPFLDLRGGGTMGRFTRAMARTATPMGKIALAMGFPTANLLAYSSGRFLRKASHTAADLCIVRSELGLWAGNRLLDRGVRVGVDFEDWYSEDYPLQTRVPRRIAWIKALERRLAKDCTYRLASSGAMAEAIAAAYGVTPPTVVYNSFPDQAAAPAGSAPDRQSRRSPSVHWFSQTIGPGRGLETFFRAIEGISLPFEVHLRGNVGNHAAWLESAIPVRLRSRAFVHPTVANHLLPARIAEHDIGLALESAAPRSRDLTVTNKLLQYLQAGLAVIATDTAGQREVLAQASAAGILVRNGDVTELRDALVALLGDPQRLLAAKAAAREAFRAKFCWDRYAGRIVGSAQAALSLPPPRNP